MIPNPNDWPWGTCFFLRISCVRPSLKREVSAKFLSIDVQDVHKLFIENVSAIFVKFHFFIVEEPFEAVLFAVSVVFFESFLCLIDKSLGSKWTDLFKDGGWIEKCTWLLITNFREKLKVWALLLQNLPRYFMLRTRRFLVALTKCRDQKSSSLFSSSWYIIRRSFSREDTNMSGKSLPKWIQPEGTGELKLYNSLTREKVRFFYFIYFFLLSFSWCSVVWCNICWFSSWHGLTNHAYIRFHTNSKVCVILQRKIL